MAMGFGGGRITEFSRRKIMSAPSTPNIITPNIGTPNASLSSPLTTPGYPMVVVPMASPIAADILKEPDAQVSSPVQSATHKKGLAQSHHESDRSI
jgi:hypothetical protein